MLRKLQIKDANNMLECLQDTNVTQFMNLDGSKMSLSDCEKYISNSWNDLKNLHFAIVDTNDNWVGTVSLKNIDNELKQAEYAIVTSSKVHGKGYAYKATKEILDYGFNELKLRKIYLNVTTDNVRANKFYVKVGFLFDKSDDIPIIIKGKQHYLNWYYICC